MPVKSPDAVSETVTMVRESTSSSPRTRRGRFLRRTGPGILIAAVVVVLFRALSRERIRLPQTCSEWPETEAFRRQAARAVAAMDALDWRWTLAGQGASGETAPKA